MKRAILMLACLLTVIPIAAAQSPNDPAELWRQASVYRDRWGVPHVAGETPRAMAFAFGYAQAQDHLETMLLAYRVAGGEAAAVLGESHAASDEFALRMGHGEMATDAYALADDLTRELCEGFALGVNTWIVEAPPDWIPAWADGVKPEDVLALLHCYLTSFSPFDLPGAWHRPAAATTGNAWAVGPDRSASGAPLLVVNPHADYRGVFQWYEAHLSCPGYEMYGATLYGVPVIMQGHNGNLGWGLTPNEPDNGDIYLEAPPEWQAPPNVLAPPDVEKYVDMYFLSRMRPKSYLVSTPGGLTERSVDAMLSSNGPFVGKHQGLYGTYRVGGYQDFGALRQFYIMGEATGLGQFQSALAMLQMPCFHVVYADRDGNIFYRYNVKVGEKWTERSAAQEAGEAAAQEGLKALDWTEPVPADDPRLTWGRTVPPSQLPTVVNPQSGYLQACGNPPWAATVGLPIGAGDFADWFARDRDSYRARRVRHLLGLGPLSFEDMQAMLYDVLVPFAVAGAPAIIDIADQQQDWVNSAHPDLPAFMRGLRQWNYVAEPSSPGMTLFHVWWASYRGLAPAGANETDLLDAFGAGTADPGMVLKAADQAARLMRSEFGGLDVPWGDVHVIRRGDRELPMPGALSGQPVFAAGDVRFEQGKWISQYGYGYASVIEFGAEPRALSIVPFGSSELPQSPHFDDQLDMFADRRMKIALFDGEDIEREARRVLGTNFRLRPRGMDAVFNLQANELVEARLTSSVDAPAPLPENMDTYTVFVQPEYAPREAGVSFEATVRIPEEVATDAQLRQLTAYSCGADNVWRPLAVQERLPRARTVRFRFSGMPSIAILGPAIPEAEQASGEGAGDDVRVEGIPKPDEFVEEQEPLEQAEAPDGPAEAGEPVLDEGKIVVVTERPESEEEREAIQAALDAAEGGRLEPAGPPPVGPAPLAQNPPEPEAPDASEPPAVIGGGIVGEGMPPAPQTAAPDAPPDPASAEPAPEEVRELTGSGQGPIAWGRRLELAIPGVSGGIRIDFSRITGARAAYDANLPAAPPERLAPFTPAIRIDTPAPDSVESIVVSLGAREEDGARAHMERLALYALDDGGSWRRMEDQHYDPETRLHTAPADSLGPYVLLGPTELRL
jgi:acyl-homoserine-lactone acylase